MKYLLLLSLFLPISTLAQNKNYVGGNINGNNNHVGDTYNIYERKFPKGDLDSLVNTFNEAKKKYKTSSNKIWFYIYPYTDARALTQIKRYLQQNGFIEEGIGHIINAGSPDVIGIKIKYNTTNDDFELYVGTFE